MAFYNMNDICRFSRDNVVECSERQVSLVLNQFVYVADVLGDRYFSDHLAKSEEEKVEIFARRAMVD